MATSISPTNLSDSSQPPLAANPLVTAQRIVLIASFAIILMGVVVLLGWALSISTLKNGLIGTATMKPNTAIGFIIAGIALRTLQRGVTTGKKRGFNLSAIGAIALLLIGGLTLLQYGFGWNLGIDQLLFQDAPFSRATSHPGQMGVNTALNFVLVGTALWLLQHDRLQANRPQPDRWSAVGIAQILSLMAGLIAVQALIGYAYNVRVFYQFSIFTTSMALHTALTFIVLAVGLLCASADRAWMQPLSSPLDGGVAARQLIPSAIGLPLVLGWLILQGERSEEYDSAFGLSLLAVALNLIYLALIWRSAVFLNRTDCSRRQALQTLQRQTEVLQQQASLLDLAHEAIFVRDAENRITYWNQGAEAEYGWTQAAAIGHVSHTLLQTQFLPDCEDVDTRLQQGDRWQGDRWQGELLHTHKAGHQLTIESRQVTIRNPQGEVTGFLEINRNITDRKREEADRQRAELALRESEARLKLALEAAELGTWTFNLATREFTADDRGKAMHGYAQPEVETLAIAGTTIHSDDFSRVDRNFWRAIASRQKISHEYRAVHPNGDIRWIASYGQVFVNPADSQAEQVFGIVQDITHRKQIEATLRASENLYRTLTQAMPQFVWTLNPNGSMGFANLQWCDYMGMTPAHLNQVGWEAVLHPEDLPKIIHAWETHRHTGEAHQVEARYRRSDGVYRWFLARAVALKDEAGQIIKWLGTHTDIEDLKQAQAERDRIFTMSTDIISVAGFDGYYKQVNPACESILGYTEAEFLAQPFMELIHPDDRAKSLAELERLATGATTFNFENRQRCKDGSYKWLLWNVMVDLDKGLMYGIARDVTDRKQAEQRLAEQEQRYRTIFESVGVSIWEEDFSEGKAAIDQLKTQGVQDFQSYFDSHPAQVQELVSKLKVLNVNDRSIDLFQAEDKAHLLRSLAQTFLPESLTTFKNELVAIANGATSFEAETVLQTLTGARVDILLTVTIPDQDFSRVLVTLVDITDRQTALRELKRTEAALRQSQARLQLFYESELIGMLFGDTYGGIADANDAFLHIIGYDRADLESRQIDWVAITPPEYLPLDDERMAEAAAQGACTPYEKEYIRKDGRRVHVLIGYALMGEHHDQSVVFILDITARKQAEAEILQLNQELQRQLIESQTLLDVIPIGIGIANDPDCHHIRVNRVFAKQLGISQDVNASLSAPADQRPTNFKVYRNGRELLPAELPLQSAAAYGRETLALEVEVVHEDGKIVNLLEYAAPLFDQHGNLRGSVGAFLDITDRKQAAAALQASEERLRQVVEQMPVMMDAFDADGNILLWNQECERVTGYTAAEMLNNPDALALLYPDPAYREAMSVKWQTRGNDYLNWEWQLTCKDGTVRTTAWSNISDRFPIPGWASWGVGIDVTERKRAEAEVQQFNATLEARVQQRTAQLEAANKELEAFSYSVSHDLRAPLRHIAGFVDLLQKRLGAQQIDDTTRRYLKIITDTTRQAGILIDDLLSFSRVGRSELHFTSIDMNILVQEVRRDLQTAVGDRTIHWRIESLPTVTGDPTLLRLVIQNLLDNAIKYTKLCPQTEIAIGSTSHPQEVVFFVKDNGIGFDMKYVHKIFGVFQRLHTDPNFEGTGVGLANVQRIIHRHKGRVWAEGMLNQGAIVYFSLPIIELATGQDIRSGD